MKKNTNFTTVTITESITIIGGASQSGKKIVRGIGEFIGKIVSAISQLIKNIKNDNGKEKK